MKFQKYNSLENHYRELFIQKVIDEGLAEGLWVANEKIHGSNFSFWYDGTDLRTAKRSGFDDNFATAPALKEAYRQAIRYIYDDLIEEGNVIWGDTMVIYGEVFGGSFHGEKGNNAKTVQKGMHYHPETEFAAFDIGIETTLGLKYWLPYDEMKSLLDGSGIIMAPEIQVGTLQELLELNNEFPTLVPDAFGIDLPKTVSEHAIGEGLVIRPFNENKFLKKGNRVIIKSKNSKFAEKGKEAKTPKDFTLNEENALLFQEFSLYLTSSRLEAVISKEYTVDDLGWKLIGALSGKLMQDAIEDYNKQFDKSETNLKDLVGDQWKKFTKHARDVSMDIVREHFKRVL